MKKKIIITGSVIIALGVLLLSIKHFQNKKPAYYWRSVPVEKGDVTVLVTATGSMAADTSVDVGVQVSGIIAKIKADFNDVVKKGQVIAILDTTLYYAAKSDAAAVLQKANITMEQAKREFNRTKNLFENKVAAQADYDQAITAYETAQANVISAKAQLNRAVINLRYCTITAPISGVVIARNMQVGNMVIASFNSPVLFTIAYDLTKMQLQADVDEADIGQVKVGQATKFTVDAYPNAIFTGKVQQIRHQPTIVQNVVNYVVIIEVPNPDLKLIPGLTGNANIFIDERKSVLKVPTNAFSFTPPPEYIQSAKLLPDSVKRTWERKLREASELKKQQISELNGKFDYLWVRKNNDIFPVRVTKGLNDGSFTEVTGDIKEGYEIVTGINHSPSADTKSSKSPFMPTFPSNKK